MGSFGCPCKFAFQLIGWVIEGRKYAAAGGDQAFFMVVS
jgi:hypothetical protein